MRRRQHLDGFVMQIDSASDFGVRLVRIKHDGARLAQALLEIENDYGVFDANGAVFADKEARDFALTLWDEIPERTALSVRFVAIYTSRIWRRKQRKLNCGLQRAGASTADITEVTEIMEAGVGIEPAYTALQAVRRRY